MAPDPDLYGPPERGNEDDEQDDDWEVLMDADWQVTWRHSTCPRCPTCGAHRHGGTCDDRPA
jgi:hypothetical protein